MEAKKNRIVIILGAGFPLMWGAPTSSSIKKEIMKILQSHTMGKEIINRLEVSKSGNFEYLLSVIEAVISYSTQPSDFQFTNKIFKINFDYDVNDLYILYQKCIDCIIDLVYAYELKVKSTDCIANNLKLLFHYLGEKYSHVCCYSLNYDEILQRLLGNRNLYCGIDKDGIFEYNFSRIRTLNYSFYNLHGSIYLHYEYRNGQYEITHSSIPTSCRQSAIGTYGGNPGEYLLFFPIITGHNKTQRILNKHFSFPFSSFEEDLSECNTVLTIGYSFNDPHVNSQIRQYTHSRNVDYRFITREDGRVSGSSFEWRLINVIGTSQYTSDTEHDDFFEWKNRRMQIYKRGVECFLNNQSLWQIL